MTGFLLEQSKVHVRGGHVERRLVQRLTDFLQDDRAGTLGNLLARFSESPGEIVRAAGGAAFKEYWMEGSRRAANARRYAQTRQGFFEEGIEGWVPHEGSIHDGLPMLLQAARSALATAGCPGLPALHEHAVLELQSEASLRDAAVRGMKRTALASSSVH